MEGRQGRKKGEREGRRVGAKWWINLIGVILDGKECGVRGSLEEIE